MIVSTKGRYALRVMIDLAEHPADGFVPVKDIAQRHNISKEYLNSILKVLVQNKLLLSLRGKGGGYKLIKAPEEYSVGEILRYVEGNLAPVPCVLPSETCENSDLCPSLPMWRKLDNMINNYLDSVSLASLMEPKKEGETTE